MSQLCVKCQAVIMEAYRNESCKNLRQRTDHCSRRDLSAVKAEIGDKILFFQRPNGDIVIDNASAQAIFQAQTAFQGVAEQLGVSNDDDVQALVDTVRHGEDADISE